MSPAERPPYEPSSTLLNEVRQGSPGGWERLVTLCGPAVWHWGRRAGLAERDLPDLLQDVLLRAFRGLPGFSRAEAGQSFAAWLCTITRHCAVDRHGCEEVAGTGRSDVHEQLGQVPAPESVADEDPKPEALLVGRAVELVRTRCNESTWEVFRRMVYLEQTASQVAKALEKTLGAVESARARFVRMLREELDGLV